jgi:O-antigen/teichoic acid export membrane protein
MTKLLAIAAAIVLAVLDFGVREILAACLLVAFVGVLFQAMAVATHVSRMALVPRFSMAAWGEMAGFGFFTWLQGMSAMILGYADRLLIGLLLGAVPVAYYTICVQVAQPIHGLVAAAYNFLFPHISSRKQESASWDPKTVYRKALWSSFLAVAAVTLPLLVFGRQLLTLWMGTEFAAHAYPILFVLTLAYGGLALNVVPHYTLLALGQARFVSVLNVVGGLLTLGAAIALMPLVGVLGAALGRAAYGPITWLAYGKVAREIGGN